MNLGQVEKAIGYHEQALVRSPARSVTGAERAIDLGNLGLAYRALGQVEKAIGYHGQALVIAREIGDRRGEGTSFGQPWDRLQGSWPGGKGEEVSQRSTCHWKRN